MGHTQISKNQFMRTSGDFIESRAGIGSFRYAIAGIFQSQP
jgi:hypothetical protein